MNDQDRGFRKRQTKTKILVVSLLTAAGVMFIALGIEVARLI